MVMTDPELFPDTTGDKGQEPVIDLNTRAELIALAAGNQGIRAAEEAESRKADSAQADLGGHKKDTHPEPSPEFSDETRLQARIGIAQARETLASLPTKPLDAKHHIHHARNALRNTRRSSNNPH